MNDYPEKLDLDQWAAKQPEMRSSGMRQYVRIVLHAVAGNEYLNSRMILKGGILMAVVYGSARHTTDLDFSTHMKKSEFDVDQFKIEFNRSIHQQCSLISSEVFGKIQSCEWRPKRGPGSFATLKFKVGFAAAGNRREMSRLERNESSKTIAVDFSFNEPSQFRVVHISSQEDVLRVYSTGELIAEKYRALIQQTSRNRFRGQDVYDIWYLIVKPELSQEIEKKFVLDRLLYKAEIRNVSAVKESLRDPELVRRARGDYSSWVNTLGESTPDFEEAFDLVQAFYESLPWPVVLD